MCQAGSEKDQEDSEKSPSALILSTNYRYSANLRVELTALTRLLPMWPGFESRKQRQRRVEFVVGSTLCYKMFFSDYSGFLFPQNQRFQISKGVLLLNHSLFTFYSFRLYGSTFHFWPDTLAFLRHVWTLLVQPGDINNQVKISALVE